MRDVRNFRRKTFSTVGYTPAIPVCTYSEFNNISHFTNSDCYCNLRVKDFMKLWSTVSSYLMPIAPTFAHVPFLCCWYSYFGLLVMPVLGFKARVDHLVVCFVTCVQWISQIPIEFFLNNTNLTFLTYLYKTDSRALKFQQKITLLPVEIRLTTPIITGLEF